MRAAQIRRALRAEPWLEPYIEADDDDLTVNERRSVLKSLLGEPSRAMAEAHWRSRREAGLPVVKGRGSKPPKDLVVAPLVVHPGVPGRTSFDPRRVEVHPDWGPPLESAATASDPTADDKARYWLASRDLPEPRRRRSSSGVSVGQRT